MFGENFKKRRMEMGYSQNDIAEKLYVTRQCVSKWEKGITQPDLQTLLKISELLDVSVDALLDNGKGADSRGGEHESSSECNSILLFAVNVLAAIFIAFAISAVWRFLPTVIPAHWNDGKVDRYGSKNEIFIHLITVAVLLSIDAISFFISKKAGDKKAAYIAHGVILTMQTAYLIFIVVLYAKYLNNVLSFSSCLCCAFIMCVSAAMHPKINKRNMILGVRTTKTMASPILWKKANTLACYLFSGWSLILFTACMLWLDMLCLTLFSVYIILAVVVIVYCRIIEKTVEDMQ